MAKVIITPNYAKMSVTLGLALPGPRGLTGASLEFDWDGTSLGVRVEGQDDYQYQDLRGPKGETGAVPNLQVGTVQTLSAGSSATVTRRSGSPDTGPIFDFGIPKGFDGEGSDAGSITYDNSESGLEAETVQDAIDAHMADIAPHPDAQTLVASRDIIHGDMHNIFTFNETSTGIGDIDAGMQLKIKLKMRATRSTNIFDAKYVAGYTGQESNARHRYTHKVIGFYLNSAQNIARLNESIILSTSDGADVAVESVGANHEVFLIIKNTAQIVNFWSVTVDITTNRGKIEVVSVTLEDIPA